MLGTLTQFAEAFLGQPLWLLIWMGWMGTVNLTSLLFLGHAAARWVLVAFLCSFVTMVLLFAASGYTRLLGLGHVLFWTPLLVHLWRSGALLDASERVGRWLRVLFATNAASLVIDYVDVARHLLGERG